MSEGSPWHHRAAAYPRQIACVIGAAALAGPALWHTLGKVPESGWLESPLLLLRLLVGVVAFAGVGALVVGVIILAPLLVALACRWNAPRLAAKDEVIVLRGPFQGLRSEVKEVYPGQGSIPLATVETDPEDEEENEVCTYERFELLKLNGRK